MLTACIASISWGLNVLESRWLEAFELGSIPNDQVATIIRAMLTPQCGTSAARLISGVGGSRLGERPTTVASVDV